jgi:hypothetical protein
MKKYFLTRSFIIAATLSNAILKAQQSTGVVDMYQAEKEKYQYYSNLDERPFSKPVSQQLPASFPEMKTAQTNSAASFSVLTNVSNVYGLLQSESAPLQYHNDLNTATMFVRKGPGYPAAPYNNDGSIVAFVGQNFGAGWDSTCMWSSNTYFGRYPQGGICNTIGNTVVAQAQLVGMGPVVTGIGAVVGNFYASKTLSVAGTFAPGSDQQMLACNAPTYAPNQARHVYSRNNFSSFDDGSVRSVAGVINDPNQLNNFDPRGAVLVKGVFSAGAFVWTTDTFCPAVKVKTSGARYINPSAYQAWNKSGSVGYLVVLGIPAGATGANNCQQPIIYKTTNSGNSWSALSGIDFNSAAYYKILNQLAYSQGASCLQKPYFKHDEGIACVVDAGNRLHIYSTIASGASDLQDSLFNVYTFMQGGNPYYWPFVRGRYPYIYDFYGDGSSAWNVNVIDSVSSQGPGTQTNMPGYNDNAWDADPNNSNAKIPTGMRLQAARDAGGNYILISYAESDTNFTNVARKYNNLPNLVVKAWSNISNKVYEKEVITKGIGQTAYIANRAMLHYMAPSVATATAPGSLTFTAPITVCNSNPYSQATDNRLWISKAVITFTTSSPAALGSGSMCPVGLKNNTLSFGFEIYPNPAEDEIALSTNLPSGTPAHVTLHNVLGQEIMSRQLKSNAGQVSLSTSGLSPGTYLVTLQCGSQKATRRLVKQ